MTVGRPQDRFLGNRFEPATWCVGFVDAPFERAASALADWRSGLTGPVTILALDGTLDTLLPHLEPLTNGGVATRELLVGLRNGWTAVFANGVPRPDVRPAIWNLVRLLGVRAIEVAAFTEFSNGRDARCGEVGTLAWCLYGPQAANAVSIVRLVQLDWDGRSVGMSTDGEVLPFEDPGRYVTGRRRDRLSLEDLARFCRAYSFDPWDPDSYTMDARLVAAGDPSDAPVRLTFDQARGGRWRFDFRIGRTLTAPPDDP